jgi:two-component system sensor histidine kinase ChvG
MAVDSESNKDAISPTASAASAGRDSGPARGRLPRLRNFRRQLARFVGVHAFSSLTRRIVILNLAALIVLVTGILYLNQFRAGLIEARVQSLRIQGEIIAGAIASSTTEDAASITIDPDQLLLEQAQEGSSLFSDDLDLLDFPINPERVAPILRRLISPTRTRARIFDNEGIMLLDSRNLYTRGQILRIAIPPPNTNVNPGIGTIIWDRLRYLTRGGGYELYKELGSTNGKGYPEVARALTGSTSSIVRITDTGELIVSVAVPIQRFRAILGALFLSTQGGDIDAIVQAERWAIVRVFLVASAVTLVLSVLLSGTIGGPLRRLSAAADKIRIGVDSREEIPDFSDRADEIGHLSIALRDMTNTLYDRIEAIEKFAADVSHELKNPLTSLRSAVETLPLAQRSDVQLRLLNVIEHDVRRLDRLITDISDASRLDAELAREAVEPVNMLALLETVVDISRQTSQTAGLTYELIVEPTKSKQPYIVEGHESRLGQVVSNLLQNAESFTPPGGQVRIELADANNILKVTIEDSGPGIRDGQFEKIFDRFYTDRPNPGEFGQNSGLGLSITKQIIEAHGGSITVDNISGEDDQPLGACFTIKLPK